MSRYRTIYEGDGNEDDNVPLLASSQGADGATQASAGAPTGTMSCKMAPPTVKQGMWQNGDFDCFSVKDCGIYPCFIPDYCCAPCVLGSALGQMKGYKEEGQCVKCTILTMFCGLCVLCAERSNVGQHYGINVEGNCCKICCCTLCVYYQLVNEIMVREQLTWGLGQVVPE
mmetsp:Transcript_608/g.1752  ORF Transcript_608/g.1752 Transcript_608/m.1752 type:complete len:171 (+) Transcript_608:85-597(+)